MIVRFLEPTGQVCAMPHLVPRTFKARRPPLIKKYTFRTQSEWSWGAPAVRAAGGVIALAGVAFLTGVA